MHREGNVPNSTSSNSSSESDQAARPKASPDSMSPSLSRSLAELGLENDTTANTTPFSTKKVCQEVFASRILKKIQQTRRGLHHITELCDELTTNAIRWSTSEDIMTRLFLSQNMPIVVLERALNCVELAVASSTAMIAFFETFLRDLDASTGDWTATAADDGDDSAAAAAAVVLPTLQQLQAVDRMATMAVRHTITLQAIAMFNQQVLRDMEGVVQSYFEQTTTTEEEDMEVMQTELTAMHQRIAVGLLIVAELALKWNTSQGRYCSWRRQQQRQA
jgi:hypothetical protein